MAKLIDVVTDSFTRYAGNVLLDRALVDARDLLKPSARMLMYSQVEVTNNIPSKPFVKSARVVGDCLGRYYTHGDSSCYNTYMRMTKDYALRYPLEDCQGNDGTITKSNDHASMRYTEMRISNFGMQLFKDIKKDTIEKWLPNFDETLTYPGVLPSKGFYNIVNGTTGIGVSLASSIPQFNLVEINNAMIQLINNPEYEVDILPDFATGAILINPDEVRASLKLGGGRACKLRSIVEYDSKQRMFTVKEIPYGVYTGTISAQIQKLVEENPQCGIEGINDGSGDEVDYVIYLSKNANPDKVLKLLYKETSLEDTFTINMNVLVDDGRRPKMLGLKDLLLLHIDHEKEVYRRGFEFDLRKIRDRIHIIDGLLICLARIEEVVQTIKSSSSTAAASSALQKNFLLDEMQAKAVLDMKLSRLAHLEVKKLEDEREELVKESARIEKILNTEELFNQQLINGWKEVAEKFGDARRTKIMNLSSTDDEPVEKKQLQISLTNKDNLIAIESSTLYTQRRGGVGNKLKLDKDEYVTTSIITDNTGDLLFFTDSGDVYNCKASTIELNQKTYISNYISLGDNNRVCALTQSNKSQKYIIFITKDGMLKKTELSEYNLKRGSLRAINLNSGDKIVAVLPCNEEDIGIATKTGNFLVTKTDDVRATGRVTAGIHGIKLNTGDEVIAAHLIPKGTKEIISISRNGLFKRTDYKEFNLQGKNTKGSKIQKFNGTDLLADFIPISQKVDLIIGSSLSTIKLTSDDVPLQSKLTVGIKSIKLNDVGEVLKILKCE